VENADWDLLIAHVDPLSIPCDSSDLSASPSCLPSDPSSTLVDAVVRFHCRPVWVATATLTDPLTTRFPARYEFVAAATGEPLPDDPVGALTSVSRWLVFASNDAGAPAGFAVGMSASGVRAFGTSCEHGTSGIW